MKTLLLQLSVLLLTVVGAVAQTSTVDQPWSFSSFQSAGSNTAATDLPTRFSVFRLDAGRLQNALSAAPRELLPSQRNPNEVILSLPLPGGGLAKFRVEESSVVEPQLLEKFPELGKTYRGWSVDDPTAFVRFDFMNGEFAGSILTSKGKIAIERNKNSGADSYISYYLRDAATSKNPESCGVRDKLIGDVEKARQNGLPPQVSNGANFRTFVIAIGASSQFSARFGGGTVGGGLIAIVRVLNQLNSTYERDLSVRLLLHRRNDEVVFAGSDFTYSDSDVVRAAFDQNPQVLSRLGSSTFDVGHAFITDSTGGILGIGELQSFCVTNAKSRAASSTDFSSSLATFTHEIFEHELGHQLGAFHTFNFEIEGLFSNVEPGFGASIMGYGIFPEAIESYHVKSFGQILSHLNSVPACGITQPTVNNIPTVSAPASFNIPKQTPFALTASANDADGDALTYQWQQNDVGESPGGANDSDGLKRPMFRIFLPKSSPTRVFPSLYNILNDANEPGLLSPCDENPADLCRSDEKLPSIARTMNFDVVVRDNHPGGGAVNSASTAVTVDAASGPFKITSPNTNVTFRPQETINVLWDVANTTNAPVSAADVNIRLSIDGGNSFPFLLANTANDGAASVTLPSFNTSQARIKVEADGNIFFDVTDRDFTIGACQPLPTGAVSWYKAEDNGDDHVGPNDAALNGNSFNTGRIGRGFQIANLDGVTVADNAELNSQTFTLDAWIKTNNSIFTKIIAAKSGSDGGFGYEFGIASSGTYLKLNGGSGGAVFAGGSFPGDGHFHHVAATYDGAMMKLFVDGVLVNQVAAATTINFQANSQFVIGSREFQTDITDFGGAVDELRFFNRALTDSEVTSIFAAGGVIECSGTEVSISPVSSEVKQSEQVAFSAGGGTAPYSFAISTNNSGGSIDPATGVYTAGTTLGRDTISVTDAVGARAVATVDVEPRCEFSAKKWDGEGATLNWSESANWTCDQIPTSADNVVFDGASPKNVVIDTSISLQNLTISPDYKGTITQGAGKTVTIGGNFTQLAGTFAGSGAALVFGNFRLSGGKFSAANANVTIGGNFLQNGGEYTGGTGIFAPAGTFTFERGIFNAAQQTMRFSGDLSILEVGAVFSDAKLEFLGSSSTANIIPSVTTKQFKLNKTAGSELTISSATKVTVTERLELIEGRVGNSQATIKATGQIDVAPTFGDQTGTLGGGSATILIEGGTGERTITIPKGVSFPKLQLNEPDALVLLGDLDPSGEIRLGALRVLAGFVQSGFNQVTVGYDANDTQADITLVNGDVTVLSLRSVSRSPVVVFGGSLTSDRLDLSNSDLIDIRGGSVSQIGILDTFAFDLNNANGLLKLSGGFLGSNFGTMNCFGNVLVEGGSLSAGDGSAFLHKPVTLNSGSINPGILGSTFNSDFTANGGSLTFISGVHTFRGTLTANNVNIGQLGGEVVFNNPLDSVFTVTGLELRLTDVTFSSPGTTTFNSDNFAWLTTTGTLKFTAGTYQKAADLPSPPVFNSQGNVEIGTASFVGDLAVAFTGSEQTFRTNGANFSNWTVGDTTLVNLASDAVVDVLLLGNGRIKTNSFGVTAGEVFSTGGYIDGALTRPLGVTGEKRFDVGTENGASPVEFNITSLPSGPASVTVRANQGVRPGLNAAQSASRFWTITKTGELTTNVRFNYLDADVAGNEESYKLVKWTGNSPTVVPSVLDTSANTISASGVSSFSDWTIGNFVPTAANGFVAGRVMTSDGAGIRNANVTITDTTNGETRSVRTGTFGLFRFDALETGRTYIVTVSANRYGFTNNSRVISLSDSVGDADFVANGN